MGAATKLVDKKVLQSLDPINKLEADKLDELASKSSVLQYMAGEPIFKSGDNDKRLLFLLSGKVEIVDTLGARTTIKASSPAAATPLSVQVPRSSTAHAKSLSSILSVDTDLLDLLLHWNEDAGCEVTEIHTDESSDWISCLLQIPALQRLSPEKLQTLMSRIEQIQVRTNDVVIRQGSKNDYYYIITQGNFRVSRKPSTHAKDILLAQLGPGESFGEEALISNGERNATITAIEDGQLLRLEREDFYNLLQIPLLNYLDNSRVMALLEKGAVLLDVRNPEDFTKNGAGINIPISLLRLKAGSINKQLKYIICADNEKQSAIAAFLLTQLGMEVYILKGSISSLLDKKGNISTKAGEIVDFSEAKLAMENAASNPAFHLSHEHQAQELMKNEIDKVRKEAEIKAKQEMESNLRNEINSTQALLDEEAKRAKAAEQERMLLQEEIKRLQKESEWARSKAEQINQQAIKETQTRLENTISQLQGKLAEERNRAKSLEQIRTQLEQETNLLNIELIRAKELAELQLNHISQLEQKASHDRDQIKVELEHKIAETNARLSEEVIRAESSEHSRNQLEHKLNELQQELDESRETAANIQQRMKAESANERSQAESILYDRINETLALLDQQTKHAEESDQRCIQLEHETSRLQQQLTDTLQSSEQYLQRITQLEQELSQGRDQLEHELQSRISDAQDKLAAETSRADALEKVRRELEQDINHIQQQLVDGNNTISQQAEQINHLEDAANSARTIISEELQAKYTDELRHAQEAIESKKLLEQEIILVRAEAYESRKQAEKETKHANAIESELERLKSDIESTLQSKITELQSALNIATNRADETEAECTRLDQALERLQIELERTREQLVELETISEENSYQAAAELAVKLSDVEAKLSDAIHRAEAAEHKARVLEMDVVRLNAESGQPHHTKQEIENIKRELESNLNQSFEMRLEREISAAMAIKESEIRTRINTDAEKKISGSEKEIKQLRGEIKALDKQLEMEAAKRILLEKAQGKTSLDFAQRKIKQTRRRHNLLFTSIVILVIAVVYYYAANSDLVSQREKIRAESSVAVPSKITNPIPPKADQSSITTKINREDNSDSKPSLSNNSMTKPRPDNANRQNLAEQANQQQGNPTQDVQVGMSPATVSANNIHTPANIAADIDNSQTAETGHNNVAIPNTSNNLASSPSESTSSAASTTPDNTIILNSTIDPESDSTITTTETFTVSPVTSDPDLSDVPSNITGEIVSHITDEPVSDEIDDTVVGEIVTNEPQAGITADGNQSDFSNI